MNISSSLDFKQSPQYPQNQIRLTGCRLKNCAGIGGVKAVGVVFLLALIVLIVLFGTGILSGNKVEELKGASKDLNVVFIVADTLRADRLPFYGSARNTAPFLNSLAERATVFENTYVPASLTAPSTATLFTSLYPSEHGVTTGYLITRRHRNRESDPSISLNRIPGDITTIGELFFDAGYRTFGISDNLNIAEQMGFAQGFEHFETYRYEGAEFVADRIRKWKDRLSGPEKQFLYLHFMDPHKRYRQREPWYSEYRAENPDSGEQQQALDAYDSDINYMDREIEKLFEEFGWLENSIVIFISEHGEEFWEHGHNGHGSTLYKEVIHVPFYIFHPELPPQRIESAVHLIDVVPTMAEMFELGSRDSWQGVSLVPALSGKQEYLQNRLLFGELISKEWQDRPTRRYAYLNGWQYISYHEESVLDPLEEMLFNIPDDPKQENNMVEAESELAEIMRNQLDKFVTLTSKSDSSEAISIEIDSDTFKTLSTLGYVE